jgi:hypothetical protein
MPTNAKGANTARRLGSLNKADLLGGTITPDIANVRGDGQAHGARP